MRDSITDTHVYLGHWPHERLPGDKLNDLLTSLRANDISSAWAGSFDGLFHKDVAGVNQRLAETCAKHGEGKLLPFGTVNPTLPDWEDDLRRCHETFHMPGIRLHPNYHDYSLNDVRFARLLDFAAARQLTVQLVAGLDDKPRKWLRPHVTQVELRPLASAIAKLPTAKLVIANGFHSIDDEVFRALTLLQQVSFDFARLNDPVELTNLIAATSAARVVFGSGAPLHAIDFAQLKMLRLRTRK